MWRTFFKQRQVRRQSSSNTIRPRLEALEDRCLPATFTWICPNQAMAGWSVPANWAREGVGGNVPGAGDTAVFNNNNVRNSTMDLGAFDYSIGSLQIVGYTGTLTLARRLNVDTLTMNNGTITAAAAGPDLTINQYNGGLAGTSFWLGGTISVPLSLNGTNGRRLTLALGSTTAGQTPSLQANMNIDVFSSVEWNAGDVTVGAANNRVTITNFGTFLGNSRNGTMGNNGAANAQWTFMNDGNNGGGLATLLRGTYTNVGRTGMQPFQVRRGGVVTVPRTPGPDGQPAVEIDGAIEVDSTSRLFVQGDLVVTASVTTAGTTTIDSGGTLTVHGQDDPGIVPLLNDGGTFTMAAGSQVTVDGPVSLSNPEIIDQNGGWFILYDGADLVMGTPTGQGTMQVNGGKLDGEGNGSGTINGNVTMSNSSLWMGNNANEYYSLSITGNLTLTGTVFSVDINASDPSQCDSVSAFTITLDSSDTLAGYTWNSTLAGSHSYSILNATNGLTGNFGMFNWFGDNPHPLNGQDWTTGSDGNHYTLTGVST
jgi:hypothetical protein